VETVTALNAKEMAVCSHQLVAARYVNCCFISAMQAWNCEGDRW
jgi:hypothetical protein